MSVTTLMVILAVLGLPFMAYGIYFFIMGLMGFRRNHTFPAAEKKHRFAAVIAARNEGKVIGNLIDSLKAQRYPEALLDIYVIPNNCTDDTAAQSLAHGAKVHHCTGEVHSKGEALKDFFESQLKNKTEYDAFCVFDADNLVDGDFVNRMNDAFTAGALVAQGYRESKNPKDTWISASQTVFYMIVNRFLNLARYSIGLSAALNGTGFMVSRKALEDGGWRTYTMTEDIEYTVQTVAKGQKVYYVPDAVTYDEHPLTFDTSWKQRKRWSTGVLQCSSRYTRLLLQGFIKHRNFACIDMIIYLAAPMLQLLSMVYVPVSVVLTAVVLFKNNLFFLFSLPSAAGLVLGLITCVATVYLVVRLEKHRAGDIKSSAFIGFWLYLFSWLFINVDCILRPLTSWEPIEHTQSYSMAQMALRR